jgi:hypothetical protein
MKQFNLYDNVILEIGQNKLYYKNELARYVFTRIVLIDITLNVRNFLIDYFDKRFYETVTLLH